MSSKSNKGVKLSLGEFMGPAAGSTATSSLPKGPAQRAPDDDGSFKRPVRRDNYNDQPPTRSEGDGNWRRGGGASGAPSSGFGTNNSSDNYNEQAPSRSEGDGNWRRGGGSNSTPSSGFGSNNNSDNYNEQARSEGDGNWRRGGAGNSSGGNRDSYMSNRSGDRTDDDRGTGGYNRDSNSDNRSGTSNNWRGGGVTGENTNATQPIIGERPRLQLKSRTTPEPTSETNDILPTSSEIPTKQIKSNPFGSAVAVDTGPKTTEIETSSPIVPSVNKEEISDEKAKLESAEVTTSAISEGVDSIKVVEDETPDAKSSATKTEKREKPKREPDVVNSRAAAFGAGNSSGVNKSEVCLLCCFLYVVLSLWLN